MPTSRNLRKEIIDYYAGRLSPDERAALLSWMDQLSEGELNQYFPEGEWKNIEGVSMTDDQLQEALKKVRRDRVVRMSPVRRYWTAAAAVLFVVAAGWWLARHVRKTAAPAVAALHYRTIKVQDGDRARLVLPDGSLMMVNGGSEVLVPDHWAADGREVRIVAGEAFFDVVRDASRPFVVQSENLHIQVLGTAFSIRDYPDEKNAETGVVSGKIAVAKGRGEAQYLLAGDRLILQKAQSTFTKEAVDTMAAAAWIRGELIFHKATLHHVLNVLRHRYAVSFEVQRQDIEDEKFSATFRNNSLETILQQLQLMSGFQYTIEGNKILIR